MTVAQAADTVGRRGIASLIEALRKKGFAVSTSEAIDATQLVVILARKAPEMDAARLSARLRPIFCKNYDQQKRFDAIFRDWYGVVETTPVVEVPAGEKKVLPPPPEKPKWLRWITLGLILVVGVVAFVVWNREPRPIAPIAPTQTAIPDAVRPSGGDNSGITLPQQRTAVFGYFPRLRYNDELRPIWGWLLAALPFVALAGFSVPALIIARTRARRRSDPMYLDRRTLEGEARRIVPPLRADISGKLARHLRGSPEGAFRLTRRPILDVRGTIEKTLQNRGIPSPQFRHTHAPPSYLLLIDVANQRDPRGRLFYQWAERLQRERLDVDIALVRLNEQNQPQFRPTSRGELPRDESGWLPLTRLPEPPFGQRLLLVSTGELLVDAGGKWRAEAAAVRLHRWRQRAMFTPTEPRDWGRREEMIERSEHTADPGFLVLPLDENALSAWTDLLTTGQLSTMVLSEPQRYPALLRRGKADDFTKDEKPPDSPLEKLIDQLRVYLGDLGFTWLAALAIPPLVRWELTVLLGRDVIEKLARLKPKDVDMVLARNYRRLVRLPWLRLETMPNWLRLRLIAELSTQRQNELRDLVEKLLGKLSPTPEKPDAIALEFERPPGRDATEPSRKAADDSDPLYLGYMSGLTPRQLAMRAPESWGRLIAARLPRERGLRGFLANTVDHARSWWARRVFLGGSPFRGLRGAPLVWAVVLLALAAGFLTLVAKTERRWWPEAIDPWLFTEEAHAIAFHHAGPVRTASFSPDGLRVLTASDDGTARVWDVKTGKPLTPPLRHAGPVVDAKFSGDGDVVATASGNQARVWNARTGEPLIPWITQPEPIREVEMRREGLLTVGGKTARIWRVNRPEFGKRDYFWGFDRDKVIEKLTLLHGVEITYATITSNGRVLTVGRDGTARIWDAKGEWKSASREIVIVPAFGEMIQYVGDGNLGRLMLKPYESASHVLHADAAGFVRASFSSDNQRMVSASVDGTARVWDVSDGHAIGSPLRHDRALTSAVFSADGMRIVTASLDGTARVWEAVADPPETRALRHGAMVTAVSFDRTGRRVVTASLDDSARVWNADNGSQLSPKLLHDAGIFWAEFSPDGRTVVTSSSDKTAVVWNWRTGKPTTPTLRHGKAVLSAVFSPDGFRVVTASADDTARVWDARTRLPEGPPMRHEALVWRAVFARDSRHVATASADGTGRIWESETGKPVGVPLRHSADSRVQVQNVAFSPDGRLVVTAGSDSTARIWNARTGLPATSPLKHDRVVYAEFDPAGRRVVTAGRDKTVGIWDAATGKLLRVLRHDGQVICASFSSDGRRILTCSSDGTARIWSADTGQLLGPPMRHISQVLRVAFSLDGRRVITGSSDLDSAKSSDAFLPTEYVVPPNSAQIWHAPPWPTPDTTPSLALRRRADRVLESVWTGPNGRAILALPIPAFLILALFLTIRRRRQIERLARAKVESR